MTSFSILLFLFKNLRTGSLCKVGFTTSNCLNSRVFLNLFSSVLRGVYNLRMDYGGIYFEKNDGYRGLLLCFNKSDCIFMWTGGYFFSEGGLQPKVTAIFNDELESKGY